MKTYRCSALPRIWICPASGEAPEGEVQLNVSDEASEVGVAFHRWIAGHIKGEDLDSADLAKQHACDEDELAMLCAMGRKAWEKIRPMLGDGAIETEYALQGCIGDGTDRVDLTGTADVLASTDKRLLIVDWKTGRLDSDYYAQLMGYCLCALQIDESYKEATIITVWVRQGDWDVVHVNWTQAQSWAEELSRRLQNGKGNFNPGPACTYCPRAAACPGRRAMVRAAIQDWSGDAPSIVKWDKATREALGPTIGETRGRMKVISQAIEAFDEVLKQDVAENGDLPIGPGRKLSLVTINKRVIDVAKARPVLARNLSQEAIDKATTVSAGKLDDAIMEASEHGQGAKRKRALAALLDEAGAVSLKEEKQLRETRA